MNLPLSTVCILAFVGSAISYSKGSARVDIFFSAVINLGLRSLNKSCSVAFFKETIF